MEQDRGGLSDLDYWRKFGDEVPNTVKFMEDHGVKLIHHDEENAALDFETPALLQIKAIYELDIEPNYASRAIVVRKSHSNHNRL